MKNLKHINFGILAIYLALTLVSLLDLSNPGMDAAGRGMTMGFTMIAIFLILIFAGLNLINKKWVRVLVLIIILLPLANYLLSLLA